MSIDLYKNLEKVVCPKIGSAIGDFVTRDRLTFFGYFLQNVNFFKTSKIKTAGVNFRDLKMNFYYNEKFVNKLNEKQVKFLCLHEVFHLIFNHPSRGRGYNHGIANFSMDMIINEIIAEKYCEEIVGTNGKIQKESVAEWIPGVIKMDSHCEVERIFELIYAWVNEKYLLWKDKYGAKEKDALIDYVMSDEEQKEFIDGLSGAVTEERKRENEELGIDDYTRQFFENNFPSFDEHFWDDISDEIKEQIVSKHIENLKSLRGINSDDSEEILGRLIKKSNNNFLKYLKKSVSALKGFTKVSSYKKPSRKDLEGLKGRVKHSDCINCILDTSGSMMGNFEIVLSEIFKDDYRINMIQCDSQVKKFVTINNKSQIQKMKIVGLGGTTLQPGIDYITSNRDLKGNNLVILTDGQTDTLDFSNCNGMKILILSANVKCPLVKNFKNVTQIIVQIKDKK